MMSIECVQTYNVTFCIYMHMYGHCYLGVVGFLNHESNITESSDPALRILNITFGLISGQLCDPVVVYYYVVDANSTAGE